MQLEVGKSYRTVDGRNTGPLYYDDGHDIRAPNIAYRSTTGERLVGTCQVYLGDGSVQAQRYGEENDKIVAEWVETPPIPVPFQLEVGKSYRTVDGRNTGPLKRLEGQYYFHAPNISQMTSQGKRSGNDQVYNSDGSVFLKRIGEENDKIVAEWVEPPPIVIPSPIQRQLVPGSYGLVKIFEDGEIKISHDTPYSPERLRAAAATLIEIAEFLESSNVDHT